MWSAWECHCPVKSESGCYCLSQYSLLYAVQGSGGRGGGGIKRRGDSKWIASLYNTHRQFDCLPHRQFHCFQAAPLVVVPHQYPSLLGFDLCFHLSHRTRPSMHHSSPARCMFIKINVYVHQMLFLIYRETTLLVAWACSLNLPQQTVCLCVLCSQAVRYRIAHT